MVCVQSLPCGKQGVAREELLLFPRQVFFICLDVGVCRVVGHHHVTEAVRHPRPVPREQFWHFAWQTFRHLLRSRIEIPKIR